MWDGWDYSLLLITVLKPMKNHYPKLGRLGHTICWQVWDETRFGLLLGFTHDFHKINVDMESMLLEMELCKVLQRFSTCQSNAPFESHKILHISQDGKMLRMPIGKEHIFCLKTPFAFCVRQSPIQKKLWWTTTMNVFHEAKTCASIFMHRH